ncbi:fluoride efflux transporter FluC [Georgenia thermotolerans]|uniref:fluoride efflux transporter FluC n=1 Tax=Georgenia thermotolerans TaxID=527326 RepID=UPI001D028C46|nr:CrcB family protein [Georgenia thermotolerans]
MTTGRQRRSTSVVRLAGLVALGGMVGVTARAHIEATFPAPPGGWPWATFAINLVGSLVLGVLLESLLRSGDDTGWRRGVRLGCGTGIIGGFTTYSTFILEVEELLRGGHTVVAVAYPLVSVVLGLVAAGCGIAVAAAVSRRRRAGREAP